MNLLDTKLQVYRFIRKFLKFKNLLGINSKVYRMNFEFNQNLIEMFQFTLILSQSKFYLLFFFQQIWGWEFEPPTIKEIGVLIVELYSYSGLILSKLTLVIWECSKDEKEKR